MATAVAADSGPQAEIPVFTAVCWTLGRRGSHEGKRCVQISRRDRNERRPVEVGKIGAHGQPRVEGLQSGAIEGELLNMSRRRLHRRRAELKVDDRYAVSRDNEPI